MWFREDLRLADQPALTAAIEEAQALGAPLACLFVLERDESAGRPRGGASRWWLAGSLRALEAALAQRGNRLIVLDGAARELVPAVVAALGAVSIHWNRRYGGAERALDGEIKADLTARGLRVRSHNGHLLHEPWTVTTRTGAPMKVFTPFWRAAQATGAPAAPLPAPSRLPPAPEPWAPRGPAPVAIDALGLEPVRPDWAGGLRATWQPGEAGAQARIADFLETGLAGYALNRNRPDLPGTSRLSPHLRFGEISARQCWHAAEHAVREGRSRASDEDLRIFHTELGWREFSYHLLYHGPELATRNHNPRFDAMPWAEPGPELAAWQRGRTGYPIVDAGMRQLWHTGWMHNRVRMIVGSFLVKHLMLDWRLGEAWFWDTLVDADPASNAASWQWVAGSGADAAPYYRIFNPVLQGEKFDPAGAYVRHWVPELARMPQSALHKPWAAPRELRMAAGVNLGQTYPAPIVDHDMARQRALAAFQSLKGGDAPAAAE
jgi:deoxyribodipyrimidine photo-lyase